MSLWELRQSFESRLPWYLPLVLLAVVLITLWFGSWIESKRKP